MYRGDTELSEPKKGKAGKKKPKGIWITICAWGVESSRAVHDKWLDQADDVESERTNKDVSSSSRSGQTGLLSFININSFLIFKCA